VDSDSPEQTQLLGSYLGELARSADVFLLVGELGAGKTCLVQGIAQGLAAKEHAFSPSFVLLREYHGRLPLYHIDLYRLEHVSEVADLGLEDYLYGDGVCVIEWADKGPGIVPDEGMRVSLQYVPDYQMKRTIVLSPRGERYLELTDDLKRRAGLSLKMQYA
jgi:tRNA threonylcarbamoyladenosine biosynthesis protein TsaE